MCPHTHGSENLSNSEQHAKQTQNKQYVPKNGGQVSNNTKIKNVTKPKNVTKVDAKTSYNFDMSDDSENDSGFEKY